MLIPTTPVLLSDGAGDGGSLMTGKELQVWEVEHVITQFQYPITDSEITIY